jgi:hypothetical protein
MNEETETAAGDAGTSWARLLIFILSEPFQIRFSSCLINCDIKNETSTQVKKIGESRREHSQDVYVLRKLLAT